MHKLNPLTKGAWVLGYMILAFTTKSLYLLYGMALVALVLGLIAGVRRAMVKGLAILLPVFCSIVPLQIIAPAVPTPWELAGKIGPLSLYTPGVYVALMLFGRIFSCLAIALVLLLTTHPSDLFTSLAKLRVPYMLNFMLAMTMQLIPVFQREVGIIMSAQKSRGMKGSGFSAVLPSFVPVFVGAIERVQQLSISLESRGFGSQGKKTSYRQVSAGPVDWVVGIAALLLPLGAIYSLTHGMLDQAKSLIFPPTLVVSLFVVCALSFLALIFGAAFLTGRK